MPYSGSHLDVSRDVLNFYLLQVRMATEETFGILVRRRLRYVDRSALLQLCVRQTSSAFSLCRLAIESRVQAIDRCCYCCVELYGAAGGNHDGPPFPPVSRSPANSWSHT